MAYSNYGQSGYYNYPMSSMQPAPMQMQSYAPAPPQQQTQGMIWVDGEVGAKAYQMPAGWPVGTPIPLWDTNDQIIYLKSMNQMGMPNPLQKIHYTMEEHQQSGYLPAASAISGDQHQNYVTRDDFDQFKNELREMLRGNQSGKGQSNQQNRGGGQ